MKNKTLIISVSVVVAIAIVIYIATKGKSAKSVTMPVKTAPGISQITHGIISVPHAVNAAPRVTMGAQAAAIRNVVGNVATPAALSAANIAGVKTGNVTSIGTRPGGLTPGVLPSIPMQNVYNDYKQAYDYFAATVSAAQKYWDTVDTKTPKGLLDYSVSPEARQVAIFIAGSENRIKVAQGLNHALGSTKINAPQDAIIFAQLTHVGDNLSPYDTANLSAVLSQAYQWLYNAIYVCQQRASAVNNTKIAQYVVQLKTAPFTAYNNSEYARMKALCDFFINSLTIAVSDIDIQNGINAAQAQANEMAAITGLAKALPLLL